MVRQEAAAILGDEWRAVLRRFGPEGLSRAGLQLARCEVPPQARNGSPCGQHSVMQPAVWQEARRQRMEAVLCQLLVAGDGRQDLDLSPRGWAGLLWASARCRAVVPEPVLDRAATAITPDCSSSPFDSLQPSDVARSFWAAAKLRWASRRFLELMSEIGCTLLPECSSQDLSNLAWASATLRHGDERWLEAIATSFANHSAQHTPQAVSNVVWGISKATEGKEHGKTHCSALLNLAPAAISVLKDAESQNVANILWAYAKLDVCNDALVEAAVLRMIHLLPEASTQHLANAAWAVARLKSRSAHMLANEEATPSSAHEMLLNAVADYLHVRIKNEDGIWQRRWAACSLQHLSMLCWSFAKAMPDHTITSRVLADVLKELQSRGLDGGLKAQEQANLFWAFSEVAEFAPFDQHQKATHGQLVKLMCDPKLRITENSLLATLSSIHALSKIYSGVDVDSRRTVERWLQRSSRRCCNLGLGSLKVSEVVVLVRSLLTCRMLHARLLKDALECLRDDRKDALQPFEIVAMLEAVASVRLPTAHPAILEIAGTAARRLSDFQPRELVALLWAVRRITSVPLAQLEPVLLAGSAALARNVLVFPSHASGVRQIATPLESGLDGSEVRGSELPMEDWVKVLNSIMPLQVGAAGVVAPDWILAQFVHPWRSWLSAFLKDISREASGFAAIRGKSLSTKLSDAAFRSAAFRYQAAVQRGRVGSLGPRWIPEALQQLGIAYVGVEVPQEATDAVKQRRAKSCRQRGVDIEYGVAAWLQADLRKSSNDPLSSKHVEHCAWSGEPSGLEVSGKAVDEAEESFNSLVAVSFGRHDRGRRAEFRVLNALATGMANDGWKGQVFLYSDRTPCLSCIGALLQIRHRWPDLAISVGFNGGVPERFEARDVAPLLVARHPAAELESAICSFLRAGPAGKGKSVPVAFVGTDPRVRDLWSRVSATSGQAPPKNKPGKKRDWQDKLKYFLRHRPRTFELSETEPSHVSLVSGTGSWEARASALDGVVEITASTLVEMLEAGRGVLDDAGRAGFVYVEELGSDPRISEAWRLCRGDKYDRFAYFLRHCDVFEVWAPAGPLESSSSTVGSLKAGDARSRVRLWL